MSRFRCAHAEGGQGVRHNVARGRQILAGSGSQIHDALDTGQHILGFPSGHGHVLESGTSFRCGELCLRAHLTRFIPEGIKFFSRCAGDSPDLAHLFVKISGGLDGCRSKGYNGSGNGCGQRFASVRHSFSGFLELAADLVNLRKGGVGAGCLGFQLFERLLGLFDFPLERVILLLGDRSLLQLLISLFGCGFQCLKLILCLGDGFG